MIVIIINIHSSHHGEDNKDVQAISVRAIMNTASQESLFIMCGSHRNISGGGVIDIQTAIASSPVPIFCTHLPTYAGKIGIGGAKDCQ